MKRELPLLGGFVAVVLVAALAALAVPGVIADPSEERDRPGFLELEEVAVSHGPVGGESVPLAVEARVRHHGPPSRNVTVLFRAIGSQSGLVERTETVEVGTVDGDREIPVAANLTVARQGGYRIETVVYEDGSRRATGTTTVEGVGTLTPAYADTSVDFHRFPGGPTAHPAIEYTVERTRNNRTTLNVSTYLTNSGDTPSEEVRLVLKARQADSNIVADRRVVRVGEIQPGTTATPHAELTVPSNYNYYLDAVLWTDGVVLTTERSAANLNPTETLSVNRTRREVGLEVGEFERDTDRPRETPSDAAESSGDGPGFGLGVALAALVLGLGVLARRGDPRE